MLQVDPCLTWEQNTKTQAHGEVPQQMGSSVQRTRSTWEVPRVQAYWPQRTRRDGRVIEPYGPNAIYPELKEKRQEREMPDISGASSDRDRHAFQSKREQRPQQMSAGGCILNCVTTHWATREPVSDPVGRRRSPTEP